MSKHYRENLKVNHFTISEFFYDTVPCLRRFVLKFDTIW